MDLNNYTDFVHTGPGTAAGRFMRKFWQPLYVANDLAPGTAKPVRIMSEDFTLYRGQSGKPYLIDFRCAHRQTQLSAGWIEDDCIRCFYHGWKYDGSGQCVEIPGEQESLAEQVKIRSYPVQEYLGLIFVYIGEGEPPAMPRYPECEGPGILDALSKGIWPCNYFSQLDNAGDPIHIPYTHREARRRVGIETPVRRMIPEETEYGIKYTTTTANGDKIVRHFFMPNIIQLITNLRHDGIFLDDSPSGGAIMPRLVWQVPIDDQNFVAFVVTYIPLTGEKAKKFHALRREIQHKDGIAPQEVGNAILAGKLRMTDVVTSDVYKLIQIEDYVAQVGQGATPDHTKDRLCRNDIAIVLLRKIWERELRALVENRPLKVWSTSDGFNMMAQI
jgi:Phenylpropionate dioxygenase and related ring-hydroxylating dioxygenases, large terminal subunit